MKTSFRGRGLVWIASTVLWLLGGVEGTPASADPDPSSGGFQAEQIHVFKTPTCGCCVQWVEHLKAAGFDVKTTDLPDLTALKRSNGVPRAMAACHTALVGGYVIEGHVPASDIRRLLEDRPRLAGLAVPGMPIGSPGMEHPDPRRHEVFDVMAFGAASETGFEVFATHAP
ncbi:MAG: hypothetical protein CBC48_09180 [bacterium TMED88]|nr:metal-binding protein [Deltaproteobacteria bacterium]OUV31842.1 MAG: hypothetical protein CBC48_09180 [bacterium TMED88]